MKPRTVAAAILALIYLSLGLCLGGCATTKRPATPQPASAAFVATSSARLQVAKARIEIAKIKTAVAAPEVANADAALAQADSALTNAGTQIEALQAQTEAEATARAAAEQREQKADAARIFWRAWTWKLAGLCFAFGLWTFRKPILALCGVPTL